MVGVANAGGGGGIVTQHIGPEVELPPRVMPEIRVPPGDCQGLQYQPTCQLTVWEGQLAPAEASVQLRGPPSCQPHPRLLWCPEVYELEEGRFVNLEQAHRRARKGMACHLG